MDGPRGPGHARRDVLREHQYSLILVCVNSAQLIQSPNRRLNKGSAFFELFTKDGHVFLVLFYRFNEVVPIIRYPRKCSSPESYSTSPASPSTPLAAC